MTTPLEERLRAHYADRTQREALPGPDTDEALTRTLDHVDDHVVRPLELRGRRNQLWLAVAAAALVLAGAVAVVAATRGDGTSVDLGPAGETDDNVDPRPTTTPSTEPPDPTSSTSLSSGPMSGTAIVVGLDGVIGWWDGSAWVEQDPAGQPPAPATGDEQYSHVRLDELISSSGGTSVNRFCGPNERPTIDAGLTDPGGRLEPKPVAVSGMADPRPRPVQVLDPSNSDYVPVVAEVLAQLGIEESEPTVAQAVRVDLDGDGTDEVLITTDRIGEPELYGEPGELLYSVTFVRHIVGGSVQNTVIKANVYDGQVNYQPYVEYQRFGALADLNGDGRMEIVVSWSAFEGNGMQVYEFKGDGTVAQVLSSGCGV